jgi:hypothetical protein
MLRHSGVAFSDLQDVSDVSELLVVHRRFERSASVNALLAGLRRAVPGDAAP